MKKKTIPGKYFNSQPHEEADNLTLAILHSPLISTHSLTKRLTHFLENMSLMRYISTHSLTKRLTANSSTLSDIVVFQLTASRRG